MSFLAIPAFSQISINGVYTLNGKTTEIEKKVYSITPKDKADIVYFSNGLTAKVQLDADFSVNSFFQDILTTNNYHKAEFGSSTLNTTLMNGKALLSYVGDTNNSSCVVSTPMVDVELYRGLFYIESTEKKVVLAVVEGSLKCYSGKKETIINTGQALVASPNSVGIFEDKVELSPGKINTDATKRFKDESKDIISTNSILFIRIDGKTLGITL